ncbi:MAG: RadC family protein, partial [Clostridia bacterium]|nr:RadC family protein [Clostridia bacterium]
KSLHSGHRSRLRAKVDIDNDMRTFADHEMLEFQLSLVIPRRDTNKLAHELINHFGSLEAVYSAVPAELIRIKGMTTSAAYLIGTQNALMRRVLKVGHVENRTVTIDSVSTTVENLSSLFLNRNTEMFAVVLLDVRYRVIRTFYFESANPSGVFVAVEDIILRALREGASSVILAHNHPSGDVSPSSDDITITKQFFSTLFGSGIRVLEHAIFYQDRVFSFKNSGLLDKFQEEYLQNELETDKLNDSPDARKIYLSALTEYMFDPERLVEGDVKTVPREELFRRYYDQTNGAPKTEPKKSEEPIRKTKVVYLDSALGEVEKFDVVRDITDKISEPKKKENETYPDDF